MKLRTLLFCTSLLSTTSCFALFCPTNFNTINIGDSIEQVQQLCGKGDTEKKYKSDANVPQEWTYYMPVQNTYTPNSPLSSSAGTMKVTFAFVDNKVVNMTSNGIGVGGTTVCNNANLQMGSTLDDVKTACGKPAVITQTNLTPGSAQGTPAEEIIEWKYNSTPPITLVFEGGKLKARK